MSTKASVEKPLKASSGWGMLAALILATAAIVALFIFAVTNLSRYAEGAEPPAYIACLIASIVLFCLLFIPAMGFFTVQPGQARVCILFGSYVGTVRDTGFLWGNPFFSRNMGDKGGATAASSQLDGSGEGTLKAAAALIKAQPTSTKVSVRIRTLNGDKLKVNDKMGNPIEIATVVVWHVADTAKALFDVDNYQSYVAMQAETALRHVASVYAYDHLEDESDSASAITLRANVAEVSEALKRELAERLAPAGVEVDDARLTHLAYSPEIAQAMLRRQQAEAVIAARKKIVEGAVSMVGMAVEQLSGSAALDLDDERKAAMASNLMVVLCGESEARPVVNAGTLY